MTRQRMRRATGAVVAVTQTDVVRMLAQGADGVLLGRAFVYALAAAGGAGVENLLDIIAKEMRVAMTLTGARAISDISSDSLVREIERPLARAAE